MHLGFKEQISEESFWNLMWARMTRGALSGGRVGLRSSGEQTVHGLPHACVLWNVLSWGAGGNMGYNNTSSSAGGLEGETVADLHTRMPRGPEGVLDPL